MAASVTPRHQHARQQSGASSHGPVPGSPTLTNPDMILPDYEFPDSPQGRSPSPIRLWTDPNIDQMDFQLPQSQYGSQFVPTATPIIYGNGTMLSDIGEVTEVESTVGPASRRASSRYSAYTENETFGPAAAITNKAYQRRSKMLGRERRSSIESTSTITTQDNRATFADFDDSVSVDDSSFQGDDEESMASSYVEGTAPRHPRIEASKPEAGGGDYSTLYISNRAEQILANAKRRLTVSRPQPVSIQVRILIYFAGYGREFVPGKEFPWLLGRRLDPFTTTGPPGQCSKRWDCLTDIRPLEDQE